MTWEDHWGLLAIRNPQLNEPDAMIHLTAASFEKQLKRAYTAGANHRKAIHKQLDGIFGKLDAIARGGGK